MNDIDIRAKRCIRFLSDSSLPKYKRVVKGLNAFKGLDIGGISDDVRSEIESTIMDVNVVTMPYKLETFQDYKIISDSDLSKIIQVKIKMCNNIKQMTLKT